MYKHLIRILGSFAGLTCGEAKIEETGAKSNDLNSCTLCAVSEGLGGGIGERLLMKLKTGESCMQQNPVRKSKPQIIISSKLLNS
jgi:hypothetical protein